MKKSLILVLVLSFAAIFCSDDSDTSQNTPPSTPLLKAPPNTPETIVSKETNISNMPKLVLSEVTFTQSLNQKNKDSKNKKNKKQ